MYSCTTHVDRRRIDGKYYSLAFSPATIIRVPNDDVDILEENNAIHSASPVECIKADFYSAKIVYYDSKPISTPVGGPTTSAQGPEVPIHTTHLIVDSFYFF